MNGSIYGPVSYPWNGSLWGYPSLNTGYGFSPVSWTRSDGQTDSSLAKSLEKAINGEHNAIRTYAWLAKKAPNEQFRNIITDIQKDEERHYRAFSEFYSQLTGGQKPHIEEAPLPTSFKEGVEESIKDELEDSKFYLELSESAPPQIQKVLLRASQDEQRHATWFSYIWNKLRK
ncbi:hypothetical protein J2TS4_33480 [Paenibacillus sp. J2TS4]|nr:hypothetical protein J2TS4_33480 [Paenibacillus sp. J2TS4]